MEREKIYKIADTIPDPKKYPEKFVEKLFQKIGELPCPPENEVTEFRCYEYDSCKQCWIEFLKKEDTAWKER